MKIFFHTFIMLFVLTPLSWATDQYPLQLKQHGELNSVTKTVDSHFGLACIHIRFHFADEQMGYYTQSQYCGVWEDLKKSDEDLIKKYLNDEIIKTQEES